MYIDPNLHIHSTFDEAKEFYGAFDPYIPGITKKPVGIAEVVRGDRNLIVGEPGVGKTLLLEKIKDQLVVEGVVPHLILLKEEDAIAQIDESLSSESSQRRPMVLDGLDEIQASRFPVTLKKIRDISTQQPGLPIYIASRWVFINRYAADFSEYRFITVSPFSQGQVEKYLVDSGHEEAAVLTFVRRLMSFRHDTLVIQVPRYLFLLGEYLKEHGMESIERLSRNDLFDYFIYAKLGLEDKRLNADRRAITKRLLEKLALTMEIYQTNTIRKDELMTFFDDLESDLKVTALSQLDLQVLFDKTLLKDNHDSIEFDNTEFQEYLAAKDITRFADPRRAAFAFAVDQRVNEFQPSWFNTLTFLVDMQPGLLEQFIEFSGIRGTKTVDEEFLRFLSRVDSQELAPEIKRALFTNLVDYHQRQPQWMPPHLASSLPGLFDPSQETLLKRAVTAAEDKNGDKRFVPLGNIAMIVGHLFNAGAALDQDYWREQLLAFAADTNENGVLQRNALFALEQLADPSIVARLPSFLGGDESVTRAMLRFCRAVDPDGPTSLEYFAQGTLRHEVEARYGFYAMKGKGALEAFLKKFNSDEGFRQAFLDQASVFNDKDHLIIDNIKAVCDDEMASLCCEAIVQSLDTMTAHFAQRSVFLQNLGKLLVDREASWFRRIIQMIQSAQPQIGTYYVEPLLAALIENPADVNQRVASMIAAGLHSTAFRILLQLKFSDRPGAEELFGAGRALLPSEYHAWEEATKAKEAAASAKQQRLIDDFRTQLEPAPKQYNLGVFAFYLQHKDELASLMSSGDRERLISLISGSVFKSVDPAEYDLTVTEDRGGGSVTYTVSSHIKVFSDALMVARHLGIDTTPFRQKIINYIPFAYNEDLQAIFGLVETVTPAEFAPVLSVYRERRSDLWRHNPGNLIEAVERYHISDAIPVLKSFVTEPAFGSYPRQRALLVVESFVPDKAYLKSIASKYQRGASQADRTVAEAATALLIARHADEESIRERLRDVIKRAAPFTEPRGTHVVGAFEDEITVGGTYAKPLTELRAGGFEQDYLRLLDHALVLWKKGDKFYQYATYLWEIVYAYFNNLKELGSYRPLQVLEQKVAAIKQGEGGNWLAARMVPLRREYLSYLGKPRSISVAIQSYNAARRYARKEIINSQDLSYHLQEAIEEDLTRWIEAEGAYDLLLKGRLYKAKIQQREKFVQKTLKNQLEYILMKRGFQVDVYREPQLLDEKRPDLLVRYGFAGPVILEVKLTSNKDMHTMKPEQTTSYANMRQYLQGYGASHGIFLVIDIEPTKSLHKVTEAFSKIPNVWVKVFNCRKDETAKAKASRGKPKARTPRNTRGRT